MRLKWRRTDVYVTSSRRIYVRVGPRQVCKMLSNLENEIYRVQ